jgi:acetone carboxylase gamma subunit
MHLKINEYLEIVDGETGPVTRCARCGHVYGAADRNVKELARSKVFDIERAGPMLNPWAKREDFELREFYCPGCAAMFSVELNRRDAPLLWDCQPDLSGG